MQPKNLKPWIMAIIVPIPLLILTSLIQIAVRASFASEPTIVKLIVNIFSLLAGIVSVILLLGLPLWIVLLIKASNYNSHLKQQSNPPSTTPSPPTSPDSDV